MNILSRLWRHKFKLSLTGLMGGVAAVLAFVNSAQAQACQFAHVNGIRISPCEHRADFAVSLANLKHDLGLPEAAQIPSQGKFGHDEAVLAFTVPAHQCRRVLGFTKPKAGGNRVSLDIPGFAVADVREVIQVKEANYELDRVCNVTDGDLRLSAEMKRLEGKGKFELDVYADG